MSDLREAIEEPQNEVVNAEFTEVEQQEELTPEPEAVQMSAEEEQARSKGWVDLEEWKAQGKDPDEWGGFKAFNKNGSIIAKQYEMRRTHQDEIKALNEYHKTQLEMQMQSLQSQQREAVENADTEQFDKVQAQINSLQQQAKQLDIDPQQAESTRIENEWAASNGWIKESTPKAAYAQMILNQNQHLTGQDLINTIEQSVAQAFPEQNPNRNIPSMTERAKPKSSNRKEKVTMSSLNAEERHMWNAMKGNKHMSEESFLKAVENARLKG
jgi:vacuolar-type H+-ATPase subunit I/STV1